jgi:hypothetical protein
MSLQDLLNTLRTEEQQLTKQLAGIRGAISSLEAGDANAATIRRRPGQLRASMSAHPRARKRSKLSAKGRAAISAAQKARWAKIRAGRK